jgi:biotin synthase
MPTSIWNAEKVAELFELPLMELLFRAQTIHRQHFAPNEVQLATLLSIKTGKCPEDCSYCPQSAHYDTGLEKESLLDVAGVIEDAKLAKANGSTRFCMGAAWRSPPKKDFPKVIEMIKAVKDMGLETCVTLGMLDQDQAAQLNEAGLDYYNHNLDTSPEFYKKIITTRTYEDRLVTLENVRNAGINVCCGGIVGMGETRQDRIEFLLQLDNLSEAPESVPINRLMAIKGTPMENAEPLDNVEFIRMIGVARIMFPTSYVRLSAGRDTMSEEMHALCFMAGANSMFSGEKLLTAPNPETNKDNQLLNKLGMTITKTAAKHANQIAE